mgnify:CR=1 FL=1
MTGAMFGRRDDASQAAFTDNSGGSASDTIAAGVGIYTVAIPVDLNSISGAGDVLTTWTPGHRGKILDMDFAVSKPVTTAAKAATLNAEIGTTNLTGGAIALTSANCTPLGAIVAGSAITADNVFGASDTVSIEAASVTQFSEGQGFVLMRIQNLDTADFIAAMADKFNEVRTTLVETGKWKGAA